MYVICISSTVSAVSECGSFLVVVVCTLYKMTLHYIIKTKEAKTRGREEVCNLSFCSDLGAQ